MTQISLNTIPVRSWLKYFWNPKMTILHNKKKAFYTSLFQRYIYVFTAFVVFMLSFQNVLCIEENSYARDISDKRFFRNLYEDESLKKDSTKANNTENQSESKVFHLNDIITQVLNDCGMNRSIVRSTNKVDVIFDKKGTKSDIYENIERQQDPSENVIYSVEIYRKQVSDSNSAGSKMKAQEQMNNHFVDKIKENEKEDITGKLGVRRGLKFYDNEQEVENEKKESKFINNLKNEKLEESTRVNIRRRPSEINRDISKRKDEKENVSARVSNIEKQKLDIEETKKDENIGLEKKTPNISNIKSKKVRIKEIEKEEIKSIPKNIDNNKKSNVVEEKKVKTEEINKKQMNYEELKEKENEEEEEEEEGVDSLNESLFVYPNNGDSVNIENMLKDIMEYDNSEKKMDDLSKDENNNELFDLLNSTFQDNVYNIFKLHEILCCDLTNVSIWKEYELDLYDVKENGLYTNDKDIELNENILSLNSKKNDVSTLRDIWNQINRNEEKKISVLIHHLNLLYTNLKNKYDVSVYHSSNELNNTYEKFMIHKSYIKSYVKGIFNEWIKNSNVDIEEYRILIIACRLIWRKLKKNTIALLEQIITKTFAKKIKEREMYNKYLVRLYKAKYQEEKYNYFWMKFLDEYKENPVSSYKESLKEAPYID
ncbi:exported protein (PHISTb) [Plasmodium gaboni]|uniref:Exported protein (PHISTb) n=1 Tax=Plasmodium gaboni TaxID=647221 RepID=A0A151LI78_9APIC|nr:exported protein (PHISTb) [Plasmodium gaboni]KYN98671.1 exported protein (PHISTb) [Plasmodium gaboni]